MTQRIQIFTTGRGTSRRYVPGLYRQTRAGNWALQKAYYPAWGQGNASAAARAKGGCKMSHPSNDGFLLVMVLLGILILVLMQTGCEPSANDKACDLGYNDGWTLGCQDVRADRSPQDGASPPLEEWSDWFGAAWAKCYETGYQDGYSGCGCSHAN